MSLYINFEPHSWYRGFAIKERATDNKGVAQDMREYTWQAVTDNGNTYRIDEINAYTLKELKQRITNYRSK